MFVQSEGNYLFQVGVVAVVSGRRPMAYPIEQNTMEKEEIELSKNELEYLLL